MVRCCALVRTKKNPRSTYLGSPCPRYGSRFYRVYFKTVTDYYAERRGRSEKIYGFCEDHWVLAENPQAFSTRGENLIRQPLGEPDSITLIDLSLAEAEALAKEDKREEKTSGVKSNIIRLMRQSNTRDIRLDEWEEIFKKCVEEISILQVMES